MSDELLQSISEAPQFLLAGLGGEKQEGRRREVLFYAGAKVERYDWMTDGPYDLSFDMAGGDLSALNAGAPVLNGHARFSVEDVLGVIEKAERTDRGYVADLRFSDRESVDGVWKDIESGVLNSVSMGVRVLRMVLAEENKKTGRKHYMAKEWKPFEISVVPMGADPGARFLSMDPRLDKLRSQPSSVQPGAASAATDEKARYQLAVRERRYRFLGK